MLCENKVLEIYLKVKIFISQVYFASLREIDKSYAKLIKIVQKLNIQVLLEKQNMMAQICFAWPCEKMKY